MRTSPRFVVLAAVLLLLTPAASTLAIPAAAAEAPDNVWLSRRVLAIAHAGGEDEAPHSTLYAYKRAAALGAEVLEGDLRLTGDGVLVVHHDETVDATTNGTGRIDEMTYAEAFALDHAYKFTPSRWSCGNCPEEEYVFRGVRDGLKPPPAGYAPEDFTIPTAESLFETFPDHFLDLEVKTGPQALAAADALIALVEEHDAADRVIFVSFDDAVVSYVRSQLPEAITSPGTQGVTDFFLDREPQPEHQILQVPPTYQGITVLDEQFVVDAHAAGLAVWVWMDTKEQESQAFYEQLLAWGVDGILGARPAQARAVIDAAGLAWQGDPPPTTPPPLQPPSTQPATTTAPPRPAAVAPRFTG
jgi:glycerophosphoryl diester phosphodiesterase